MSSQITAGFIAKEVTSSMDVSVLSNFLNCPKLNIWLMGSGLVQHSQESNWPATADGVPLIGARVIRLQLEAATHSRLAALEKSSANGTPPNIDAIKQLLVRDLFTQIHRYVKLHDNHLPAGLKKVALSMAPQVVPLLQYVGFNQMNKDNISEKMH